MTPDLLSANVSMVFMAIVAAALLAHLSQIAKPDRLIHALYAVTAVGLFYLFGAAAFGWNFIPPAIWFGLYAALFIGVAAVAAMRRNQTGGESVPYASLMIEQAAMAYMWAPATYWKPPLAALFLLYFILETVGWLRGRHPAPQADEELEARRPPLIPPKRIRGLREFALAGAAAAMVYVFGVGTGKSPVAAKPPEQSVNEQAGAESPAPQADEAAQTEAAQPEAVPATESASKEPETPAAPAEQPAPAKSYTAAAGDTLKSIARKLYGKPEKWRAIANANHGLKLSGKLKAGQIISLPEPPTKL